jgi:hypothetical protein
MKNGSCARQAPRRPQSCLEQNPRTTGSDHAATARRRGCGTKRGRNLLINDFAVHHFRLPALCCTCEEKLSVPTLLGEAGRPGRPAADTAAGRASGPARSVEYDGAIRRAT